MPTVIHLHLDAPPKPGVGQPCNGCGVCCASEPCPVGMIVSRRRHGACTALQWHDGGAGSPPRYRCGLVAEPVRYLPRPLRAAAPLVSRWARRVIAAGKGCDSDAQVLPAFD